MNGKLNEKGVALVLALVMSVLVMAMITGLLYSLSQSTSMSAAGKRYATADEAANGAVNVMKDTINLTLWGEAIAPVFGDTSCLANAILDESSPPCSTTVQLPGIGGGGGYTANVTIQRLYTVTLPGGRLEFARSASGAAGTAIFFRISTRVTGPDNTNAEASALYRFAG